MTDSESSSQRSDAPSSAHVPDDSVPRAGSSADENRPAEEPRDGEEHSTTGDNPARSASPTPGRPAAGRSHVHPESSDLEAAGEPRSETKADANGADAPASTAEHEVFILTPDVMRAWAWTGVRWVAFTAGSYYLLCTLLIISYRWVDPPTTGVQLQRSIAAWWDGDTYETVYRPVPLASIDDDLELAVVAAEDTRFFQHTGIDWEAIGEAIEDNRDRGFVYRGGSTITQQLAKNLFQTTHSSFLRKGMEVPLTYLIEVFLPKDRILELYLNVIEWGPGVFGVEAAVRHHYGRPADVLSRYRAAALAACIPNPLARTPGRMNRYARTILGRMYQLERIEPRFAQ